MKIICNKYIYHIAIYLLGSNFFRFFQGELEMKILKHLDYKASALGNHDFDGVLNESKGIARFQDTSTKYCPNTQMLCGNILDEKSLKPVLKAYTIFEPVPGVKVGVTAVLGEEAFDVIPKESRLGLVYTDFIASARASVTYLASIYLSATQQ